MGAFANISVSEWPKQRDALGRRVQVCFHYDTSHVVTGIIVRDDAEAPWRTIISLDTGKVVLGSECQYSYLQVQP